MPRYDFRNKETGEVTEVSLRIAEYDKFCESNPQLERYYGPGSAPQINCDPISNNQHRKGFKEVLNKIHQKTPGSLLNQTTEM